MDYLLYKSLHIMSIVAWFAGLFYLVRLFVYHTEAFQKEKVERDILTRQYHIMESRLFKIICQPAMMMTWLFGLLLIHSNGLDWFKENKWLHVKVILVVILTIYHSYSKKIIERLRSGEFVMTSYQFRLYNEVPTIFLTSIVLLAVYKNLLQFGYTLAGIIVLAIALIVITKIYKKIRIQNNETV